MRKGTSKSFGEKLIESLNEVRAHTSGKRSLEQIRPRPVDVKAIRNQVRMSQAKFASSFGINKRALQEWEQGRRLPDPAVRSYLWVISRNPDAVRRALAESDAQR